MKFALLLCLLSLALAQTPAPGKDQQHQHEVPQYYQPPDPKIVKEALTKLFDEKLDANKDTYVTAQEMRDWLNLQHKAILDDNINKQWEYFKPQLVNGVSLKWDDYKKVTFPQSDLNQKSEDGTTVKEQLDRTERRWKLADANNDGMLDINEFRNFLHPEENPETSSIVVIESIEMMDKDKSGDVSLQEYMDHLKALAGPEKNQDSWTKEQQEHFTTYLDKNKDGVLDAEEMKQWVLPSYDREEGEAWRLISIADSDRDTRLTKTDMLQNHDHFMGILPPEFWMEYHAKRGKKDEL